MLVAQYDFTKTYLLDAVTGAPETLESLLTRITPEEADFRPDPKRFTIREVVAHLATWETVFRERLTLTRTQGSPVLPRKDPVETMGGAAEQEIDTLFALYKAGRAVTDAYVREIKAEEWDRVAVRPGIGELTLEASVVQIIMHDAYHFRQVANWRKAYDG